MTRIRAIYSIFPIPLHKTWDTPAYTRNFPHHSMNTSSFPDHPIKIKWYSLYTISYRGMVSTPHIPDHPRSFRAVAAIVAFNRCSIKRPQRATTIPPRVNLNRHPRRASGTSECVVNSKPDSATWRVVLGLSTSGV